MFDYLKTAIVATSVPMNPDALLLADAIDLLTERHQFGFLGYGGLVRTTGLVCPIRLYADHLRRDSLCHQ
ncbi:hypothetical protein [Enhygromyxa salina]|uniref:Uncharacterized protein n=1 Tax=Enhygromyxa salina TaxID=215803 RepID=A0A2S9Y0E0_9BACT|nr:hypothetical protein [Enhygromyxa salina]PRP98559.1 hypothetical protein ENSA7_65020 [Enhygromyxa salina]